MLLAVQAAQAQTFTQRLQQKGTARGTVTIHHDDAIDALVNGTASSSSTSTKAAEEAKATGTARESGSKKQTEAREDVASQQTATQSQDNDTRKKVIVNGTKVDGYRVQAFAGGNTRRDRQEAERVGNDIKLSFPDEPVYVHFYSPRWICRVGNYRTYEEAHQMLLKVKEMGYEKATIVKGKITVQY